MKKSKNWQRSEDNERSAQCLFSKKKDIAAILTTARKKYSLTPRLIVGEDYEAVQDAPYALGTFRSMLKGEIIRYHPTSTTWFDTTMEKKRK